MTKTKQHVATFGPYVLGLIWFGQLVSAIGSGLTNFALSVWVYQTTGSATQYALIYFFVTLASVLMMPVAGLLVDRWDRRWLMILSDTVAGLGTLAIWFLFAADQLETWHIYLFVMLIQACTALQMVTYDTTVALLVPKKHLGRANGMIQLGQAAAQIAAPVLAGALVVTIGIQGVVLIDLVTFLFAVLTLLFVRIPRPGAAAVGQKEKGPLLRDVIYGWDFIRVRPGMLGLLLYYAAVNFTLSIVVVLISPLVLSFTTPAVLGTVTSIAGCGMLLGALTMSVWGGPKRRLNGVFGFILLQAVLLFLGGLQPSAPLIAIAASIFLFSSPIIDACSQALWQSKVPLEAQGRVFAVRRVISWVTVPLANLSAGPLADNLFEPLMASDGPLAGSVGRIIGAGPGRGIGLLYIVLGILSLLITAAAYLYPRIRLLEDELPDAVGDDFAATAEERISMSKETRLKINYYRHYED